jgi:hypothetical protein
VISAWTSLGWVNGARAGTFGFDSHPSMHTINVLYKNKDPSDSGLRLRWQSQAAGDHSASTYAYSGTVEGGYNEVTNDACTYAADVCRLDNVGSSTINGLYNNMYIKFGGADATCNNRWTRIGAAATALLPDFTSSTAATTYRASDRCIFLQANWADGAAGCICATNDPFRLVEWYSLDGKAAVASDNCPMRGTAGSSKLSAQATLNDPVISIPSSDITRLGLVANVYIKVEEEIMLVIDANTNALTVTRARAGTAAALHPLGSTVTVLSQFPLNIGVPWPGTTFASITSGAVTFPGNVILFTSGTCIGRWSTVTLYSGNADKCTTVGGGTVGGGSNWKDGGPSCLAAAGDNFLVRIGLSLSSIYK